MPPKVTRGSQRGAAPSVVSALTSSENRPIVTALGLFAVGVAFLHSSWSEILLPA